MVLLITFLIVFTLCAFNYQSQYWKTRWYILSVIAILIFCGAIASQSNIFIGLLFLILLEEPIRNGMYAFNTKLTLPDEIESARTAICVLSSGIVFLFATREAIEYVYDIIPFLLISDAIYKMFPIAKRPLSKVIEITRKEQIGVMLIESRMTQLIGDQATQKFEKQEVPIVKDVVTKQDEYCYSLLGGNWSVSSSFIALLVSIMITHDYPFYLKEIGLISATWCLYSNRATAGALGFIGAISLWAFSIQNWPLLGVVVGTSLITFIIGRKHLLAHSGRYIIWKRVYEVFIKGKSFKDLFMGCGNGLFKLRLSESGGLSENLTGHRAYWAHNSFLEFFCSNGIFGYVIAIASFVSIAPWFGYQEWIILVAIIPNFMFNFSINMASDCFFMVLALKNYFLTRG
jgi:hypothetical protein